MGARIKPPREADVVRGILAYLRLTGWHAWRNNSGGRVLPGHGGKGQFVRWGAVGSGDVLALKGGLFLSIEAKRVGGGAVTPEQKAWMDAVNAAGGLAFVARSVGDVQAALRAEGVLP